jgi:hypothetical protein
LISLVPYARTTYLGWTIEPLSTILTDRAEATVGRVDRRLVPIVLSADIGKLAYRGRVQIIDNGLIGDPLFLGISRVPNASERAALFDRYLFDVMPPDTLVLHDSATCPIAGVVDDRRFAQRYRQVPLPAGLGPTLYAPGRCGTATVPSGLWTLRWPDQRRDLALGHDLLDGRVTLDRHFFDPCRRDAVTECFNRVRAFRRVHPGSAWATRVRPMLAGLDVSVTGRLATALIGSPNDGQWWVTALSALKELGPQRA